MAKKLETVDIQNIEIAAVGKWEGMAGGKAATIVITAKDLEDMVSAFDTLMADKKLNYEPPVKLGHDANQKLLQNDGYPAAGWIDSLKKVGDKLVASFRGVPKKIAELINAGAYKKISPEYYSDYSIGGETYRRVLKAASLLGADIPAVKSTADIAALYGSELDENGVAYTVLLAEAQAVTLDEIMSDLDAWLAKAEEKIHGKVGSTAIRTYLREMKGKLQALVAKGDSNLSEAELAEAVVTKSENGIDFPAEAYAYVPDPTKPSEWKLRLWEDLQKKETAAQVGMAMAAFSPGGFRGQKVEIPAADMAKVKETIVAAWKRVNPGRDVKEMPNYMMQENIEEEKMDKELRELLGIDEKADILATVKALKEKPEAVSLVEHQATESRVKALETQLAERKRDELITKAINGGKLTPAQAKLPVVLSLAEKDPAGFQAFVEAQPRVVAMGEKGIEGNALDEVQLTETEIALAARMGIKPENMVLAKK